MVDNSNQLDFNTFYKAGYSAFKRWKQYPPDLSPEVRGGKGAYWRIFGKDPDWREKLLTTLDLVAKRDQVVG